MKRSEKLLDAIGQIDDRLVEEAARAGEDNALQAARSRAKGSKNRNLKKSSLFRLQGALAACAVLAVCIGIFGLLERSGMIFGPCGATSADMAEMAAEDTNENMAAQSAPEAAEAMPEEGAAAGGAAAQGAGAQGAAAQGATSQGAASQGAAAGGTATQEASPGEVSVGAAPDEGAPAGNMVTEDIPEAAEEKKEAAKQGDKAAKQGDKAAPRALTAGEPEELPEDESKVKDVLTEDVPAEADKETAEQEAQSLGSVNGVTASIETASAERITFVLENGGNEGICYGAAYSLERFANESWESVTPVRELIWNAVGYFQEPGSSREITVNISGSYGKLEAGKYRLVKEYWLESDEGAAERDKYPVYVEFVIAE